MAAANKSRVAFLLNPARQQSVHPLSSPPQPRSRRPALPPLLDETQHPPNWKIESAVQELISIEFEQSCLAGPLPALRSQCQVEGCATAAVSKGLCVRHGGGTRCSEPGCTKRTKRFRRCYMHGGFILCSAEGCTSKAKRFGLCWAHGGGTRCSEGGCEKLSVKGGLCWTHGGGIRCRVENCGRRAYKRFDDCCEGHFEPDVSYIDDEVFTF
ncbi:Aste57867_10766 [Aphanomyces stellatus]|uniref:Aste57867_10766 protein n=1 Tax=Aphanomyces stellatus TaxID=120398 RepID=A0A485KRU1_9STRA|nr:hypothetical protein As57867_010726 [Aphanomyces stellatus]VFT87636.1 Aste57867_10766 [Aphanomyces stellatus]